MNSYDNNQNQPSYQGYQGYPPKKSRTRKFFFPVVALLVISLIYTVALAVINIKGVDENEADNNTTRRVTIQAVRGNIYDRNGNLLVSNDYSYNVALSYSAIMSMEATQITKTYYNLLKASEVFGQTDFVETYTPFEGCYPDYQWKSEMEDENSDIAVRLYRTWSDLNILSTTKLMNFINYYVSEYNLLVTDAMGERIYTDEEVDLLIRFIYELDANRFLKGNDYTYCEHCTLDFMTYVSELSLDGIVLKVSTDRVYNYPGYASHILGTVGPIYSEEWSVYNEKGYQMSAMVGKSGCELAFEDYLHGVDGEMEVTFDEYGTVIAKEIISEPVAGNDVYLTIDIDLQIAAEDGLADNTEYVRSISGDNVERGAQCNAGACVAMDPDTFEVLAIASYPTFDLTTYNEDYDILAADEYLPLLNRAINGGYAPGSTFKPGVAISALTEGVVTDTETIYCSSIYHSTIHCANNAVHGNMTVISGIANSCNTFFSEMGQRLGIDRLESYMTKFGFGQDTGFELGGITGQMAGRTYRAEIRSTEEWTDGNTWQASIGQSDTVASPLQICSYISTLSNGGNRYAAHLLYKVYEYDNDEPIYTYETGEDTLLSTVEFSYEDQQTVLTGMHSVVTTNATVYRLTGASSLPVEIGGKTGTAQNSTDCDNALFVAVAPYTDPEIAVAVVLEQGYSGGYASMTAGRVLKAYYEKK